MSRLEFFERRLETFDVVLGVGCSAVAMVVFISNRDFLWWKFVESKYQRRSLGEAPQDDGGWKR
jgi:hypothetical protein